MTSYAQIQRLAVEVSSYTGLPVSELLSVLRPLGRRGLVVAIQDGPAFGESGKPAPTFLSAVGSLEVTGTYEIASVTKPFTATVLAQLAAQGRLYPRLPLRQLGGEFAAFPPFVTPYALATHTAGLPPHPMRAGLTALLDPYDPYNFGAAQAVASARRWASPFQAGQFIYSNLGAGVLALALAKAGHAPFSQLLEECVTRPLGLADLSFPTVASLPRGATQFGTLQGAGGLWSTATDLLRFGRAHLDGHLLQDWTYTVIPRGRPAGVDEVAAGWFVSAGVWWHDGVARQSRAGLAFHPGTGRVVALLSAGGTQPWQRPLMQRALLLLATDKSQVKAK